MQIVGLGERFGSRAFRGRGADRVHPRRSGRDSRSCDEFEVRPQWECEILRMDIPAHSVAEPTTTLAMSKPSSKSNFYPVILAGGRGTRFWPFSRKRMAKQLLPLNSEKSMIQETVDALAAARRKEKFLGHHE